jgi:hypothetical protein
VATLGTARAFPEVTMFRTSKNGQEPIVDVAQVDAIEPDPWLS